MKSTYFIILIALFVIIPHVNALNIVVTFPSLYKDIKQIAPDDNVYALAINSDPHQYQLRPEDFEALKKADLIISTAHTPYELKIEELVKSGEIKAKLIEIPKINGIKILKNPETGQPNLHMPIYDPENYKVFLKFVAETLQSLNPDGDYVKRAEIIAKEVDKIVKKTKRINTTAIGDFPFTQNAVSWLGVEVKYLVIKESNLPATPEISKIRDLIEKGKVGLVVITKPVKSKPSRYLLELAEENGVPVLYVYSPLVNKSILERLEDISNNYTSMNEAKKAPGFELIIALISLFVLWRKKT